MQASFLWHDYETYGRDPARDRPVQFAAIRTDSAFEEIDDRVMLLCRQSDDYLPDPQACMVHGVLPHEANHCGLSEWQFATRIHTEMSRAGTCTLGYNSIRFDDEFTRQILFRNLFDPYAREWQNGNSRWDLIDVVRLARALRPDGIEWPVLADGSPSNRLEHLTDANGIAHQDAHDALSDVVATIGIARLLQRAQPRLFNFAMQHRSKQKALQSLNTAGRPALLHVSGMYSNQLGNLTLVLPLCPHPDNANGTLVYDLRHDPTPLLSEPWESIAERMFTAQRYLPEGTKRIPIKTVHANRCPVLAPLSTLTAEASQRAKLDVNLALRYREQLIAASRETGEKLRQIFRHRQFAKPEDPELSLYAGGFASDADCSVMQQVQQKMPESPQQAAQLAFEDPRLQTMLQRIVARHAPDAMDENEQEQWLQLCRTRVLHGMQGFRSIHEYRNLITELRSSADAAGDKLDQLENYGEQLVAKLQA